MNVEAKEINFDLGDALLDQDKKLNRFAAVYKLKAWENKPGFFITEKNQDAEILFDFSYPVITDWDNRYNEQCRNKKILIIGMQLDKAQELAESLHSIATEIKIVKIESVSDWVGNGGTKEKFREEINNTLPWGQDWPDAIPLTHYDNLPDFPSDVLPEVGREMVESVATINQVDIGLAGSVYLGALSTCLGGKVKINVVNHTEPCNLYLVQVADSGERKSATVKQMTSPIYSYQQQKADELKDSIREALNKNEILQKRLERKRNDAAKEEDAIERMRLRDEAAAISKELAENPVPKEPVYLADDITPEKLGDIMAEHDERLSIISAEGGIFDIMMGLYSDGKTNIDIFLKAHAGEPWSCYRMGRKSVSMDKPALTISTAIQSSVIRDIGQSRKLRGRGMIARILPVFCKSKAGYRDRRTDSIPASLTRQYEDHLKRLLELSKMDKVLTISPEAQALWDEFYNDIEIEMRPGGTLDSAKDFGSKLPGAAARIAALLHCAEHSMAGENIPISNETMRAAILMGVYLKDHALAIFGFMGENPKIETAKLILEYLRHHRPEAFKAADVLANKNALRTMEDIMPGISILIERRYIREKTRTATGKPGRPQAPTYEVNPMLYK